VRCGVLLFGALVLLDLVFAELTTGRAVLWAALGGLLFIVLTPPRVSARDGLLDSRGLLAHDQVRTDRLADVRVSEGVALRLVLTDECGRRLVLDPRVLTANPLLWHHLDHGVRRSRERGTLPYNSVALERLGRRIDSEACRGVLRASGLE
jgi:hypothetical protein